MNALELLRQQHAEVTDLFARLRASADSGEAAADLRADLAAALRAHTAIENELFYPKFEIADETEDVIEDCFHAHEEIEEVLVELLRTALDDEEFVGVLDELESLVLQHVTEEEEDLFPAVEEMFSPDALAELGATMGERFDALRVGAPPADLHQSP